MGNKNKKKSTKKTTLKKCSLASDQWLLIDASNSISKFALSTPTRLLSVRRLPTVSLTRAFLLELVAEWPVQRVIVASVVPRATRLLASFFKTASIPLLFLNKETDIGITFRYPRSSSIGADCLANVAAVITRYKTPAIVIDFGTAITFDIINANKAYLGEIIAPGLTTGAEALHHYTALLPRTIPSPIRRATGKNIVSAIHSGLLLGARGLVREVIERVTQENFSGQKPMIIGTGGDAKLVARGTKIFDVINPMLTLEGLREVGNLQPVPYSL